MRAKNKTLLKGFKIHSLTDHFTTFDYHIADRPFAKKSKLASAEFPSTQPRTHINTCYNEYSFTN